MFKKFIIITILLFATPVFAGHSVNYSNKAQFLQNNAYRIGTYVFIDGSCIYCRMQSAIMVNLLKTYGIHSLLISSNYCPSVLKTPCTVNTYLYHKFHITYHPVIIMIYRQDNNKPIFHQIGIGVTKLNTLTNRMYYYANQFQKQ